MTLYRLRSILSTVLTPGLNEDIDILCHEKLGLKLSPASVGFFRFEATSSDTTLTLMTRIPQATMLRLYTRRKDLRIPGVSLERYLLHGHYL